MNTDTPETDALSFVMNGLDHYKFFPTTVYWSMCDLARKLERERDKSRKWSATLADAGDEIRAQLREEQQLHIQTLNERDDARDQLRKAQVENDHNWRAMELYEAERTLSDKLAALLQRNRDGYGGQMVDPECGCCDCKWLQPIDEALAAWKEARGEP